MKKKPLPTGDALKKKAQEYGIPLLTRVGLNTQQQAVRSDDELQHDIREHERSVRDSKTWIIALTSAIAAVLSAIAALIAVLK